MAKEELSAKKLIKQSWIGQTERYEIAKQMSNQLATDMAAISPVVEKPLVEKMTEIHRNRKLLAQQVAKLDSNILQLNRQTKKWDHVTTTTRNKVKEHGDVQNWAEMIDQDLRVLEETSRLLKTNRRY